MAGTTHTAKYAYNGTLDGTDIDFITLTQSNPTFTFLNRSSTATMYVTVDGTTPSSAGDNCYPIPPGYALAIPVPQDATVTHTNPAGVQVQLISSASCAYSVMAL